MLYNNQIRNYNDFKERFGYKIDESGRYLVNKNGVIQRKNNIVYQYYKASFLYYRQLGHSLKEAFDYALRKQDSKAVFAHMLYNVFDTSPSDPCPVRSFGQYEIVNNGICVDGDISAVRYKNNGHVYKMKIGKYVNKFIDEHPIWWDSVPVLRTFFVEELTELWKNKRLKESQMHIVVDTNFEKSYTRDFRESDQRNFYSCMDDTYQWEFYSNHPKFFSTVRLEDGEGLVYARCNLIKCWSTQDDSAHTLLDRIYMNKKCYSELLFEKAKAENIFDIYKSLEASCRDSMWICSITDNRKINYELYVPYNLENGETMAYQDTFKYYSIIDGCAYNGKSNGWDIALDSTEPEVNLNTDDDYNDDDNDF